MDVKVERMNGKTISAKSKPKRDGTVILYDCT